MIIKKIIPLRFRWMIESILNAYSMVLFTGKKSAGFVLMLLTFFDPIAGGFGLIGIVLTNLISYYLGVIPEKIKKGLYGFNGLLVGLAFPLYHAPSLNLFLLLFVACLLLVIVTIWLEGSLGYFFGLPALSFPFVIVTFLAESLPETSPPWPRPRASAGRPARRGRRPCRWPLPDSAGRG